MRRSHFAPLLAIALLCCKAQDPAGANQGVTAVQFSDIVVPDAFTLRDDRHQSHSTEAGWWRNGHFVYTGRIGVDEAASYLLLRMPQHKWTLESDLRTDEHTRSLRFTRGRYVADYTLKREEGVSRMTVDYRTDIERR